MQPSLWRLCERTGETRKNPGARGSQGITRGERRERKRYALLLCKLRASSRAGGGRPWPPPLGDRHHPSADGRRSDRDFGILERLPFLMTFLPHSFPILKILAPQVEQTPAVTGRPFFSVS